MSSPEVLISARQTGVKTPESAPEIVAAESSMMFTLATSRREPRAERSSAGRLRLGERHGRVEATSASSGAALVMLEHAAERFDADDLLALGERLIDVRPVPGERPIADAESLVRTRGMVMTQIRRNQEVEVPLAENQEIPQTFVLDALDESLDERILVRSLWGRSDDVALRMLEDLIELNDVHSIAVADDVRHGQSRFAGLLEKNTGLTDHPLFVGREAARRTEDPPRPQVQEGQDKGLPQARRRPIHLAEEVDLPQRVDVRLEELAPSALARTALRPRLHPSLFEDVFHSPDGDRLHPQFPEFADDAGVAPSRLAGQSQDNISVIVQED